MTCFKSHKRASKQLMISLLLYLIFIPSTSQTEFCYGDFMNPAGTYIKSINLPNGQFAFCYHIPSTGLYYQAFNADYSPVSGEVEVVSGNHGQCRMTYRPITNDIIIGFSPFIGVSQDVAIVRLDLDGSVVDPYVAITNGGGQEGGAQVVVREDNKLIAFYLYWGDSTKRYMLFDADLNPEAGPFVMNHFGSRTGNGFYHPIPTFANGNILFAWSTKQANGGGTSFTIFDPDMIEIQSFMVIDNGEISDHLVSVVINEDDDFIFAHVTRDSPQKLKVFKFDNEGNLLAGPVTQTANFNTYYSLGDIKIMPDGRILIVEQDFTANRQLHATIINPDMTVSKALQRISGGGTYDGLIELWSYGILQPQSGNPLVYYESSNNGIQCPEECETDDDCSGNPCFLFACGRCSSNGDCSNPDLPYCDDDNICRSAEIILTFVDFTEEDICTSSQVNFEIEFDYLNDPSLSATLDRSQCTSADTAHLNAIDAALAAISGAGPFSISTTLLYESETYAIEVTSTHGSETVLFTTPARVYSAGHPEIIGFSNNQEIILEESFTLEASVNIQNCAAFNSDPYTITYQWYCENADTGKPCDDPDGIYGVPYVDEPELEIPYQYQWLNLKFTVEVMDSFGDTTSVSDQLRLKFLPPLIDIQNNDPRCYMKILNLHEINQYSDISDITWEQLAEAGDNQDELEEYLTGIPANSLIISKSMIDVGAGYTFRSSYTDSDGNQIVNGKSFDPIQNAPKAIINSNLTQKFIASHNNYLVAQSECLPSGFTQEWTQISGSELQIEDHILKIGSVVYSNILRFDACTLLDDSVYRFRFTISDGQDSTSHDVEVQTIAQEEFVAYIQGGNQQYKVGERIILEAKIITPYDLCSRSTLDPETFKYRWECYLYNSNTFEYDIECDDPTNIFEKTMEVETLSIPRRIFSAGDSVKIQLEILDESNDVIKTSETIIEILNHSSSDLSIECLSQDQRYNCYKFSPTSQYLFKASIDQSLDSYEVYELVQTDWSTTPILSSQEFINRLRNNILLTPNDLHSYRTQQDYLSNSNTLYSTTFLISNDTTRASSKLSISINQPPSGGSLSVIPEEGLAIFQTFVVRASQWEDTDLPLEYRFYFINEEKNVGYQEADDPKITTAGQKRLLGRPSQLNEIRTPLTLDNIKSEYEDITVIAEIVDGHGSYSTVTQEVRLTNKNFLFKLRADLISDLINVLQFHTDPLDRALQLSLISFYARGFDYQLEEKERSLDECECGRHGKCSSGSKICSCDSSYTLPHCTVKKSVFEDLVDNKAKILDILNSAYEGIIEMDNSQHSEGGKILLDILNDLSKNSLITSANMIVGTFELFTKIIDLIDFTQLLSRYLSLQVAEIFDNLLDYIGVNDCEGESTFSDEIVETATKFLQKISDGLTAYQLPNQKNGQIIYKMKNFDLYVFKITECGLNGLQVFNGENSPSLLIFQRDGTELDCYNEIKFSYFTFNEELMNCDLSFNDRVDDSIIKDLIIVQIIDAETGEELQGKYQVQISLPYERCDLDKCQLILNQTCLCDSDSSIFDPRAQLQQLLDKSNLDKIFTGEVFDASLFSSPQFWLSVIFGLGTLATAIIVKKKAMDYCFLENFLKSQNRSKLKGVLALFLLTHPALNGPFIGSIQPTKMIRISLYYARFLMTTALVAILGSNQGFSGVSTRVLSTELTLQVNIIVLILPFVTVIPLEVLLKKMLTQPKKSFNRSKMYIVKKGLYWVGIGLIITVSIGCFLVICRIGQNASHGENMALFGTTAITIGQDWVLTPLLLMILQLVLADNESVQVMNHTTRRNISTKDDVTMPSTSKKNMSKVFPFSKITDQEAVTPKLPKGSDERKETEGLVPQDTEEGDTKQLLNAKKGVSTKRSDEKENKSEIKIESSQDSLQRLNENEKGNEMSMKLEKTDQLSQNIQDNTIIEQLGKQSKTKFISLREDDIKEN